MLLNYFLLILTLTARVSLGIMGSCKTSRKCCDGKDPNCIVNQDNEVHGEYVEPCYCDHGCLELGDCCPDFKDYCGVIDCRVGEWSEWSDCDVDCGIGTSIRNREIIHPSSNGGKECPHLNEKQSCTASKCNMKKWDKISPLRETAMLLPGKYAPQHRRSGRKYDVRANLKSYKYQEKKMEYCVIFDIEKSMKSCQRNEDTLDLIRGNEICVSCDSKAQREHLGDRCTGHGVEGKLTRFKNILSPSCHGKWIRKRIVQGKCPCSQGPDFIFV